MGTGIMSTTSVFFAANESDDSVVKMMKIELAKAVRRYQRTMISLAESGYNLLVCTHNHGLLDEQFAEVHELRKAILKLSNHDGKFINL